MKRFFYSVILGFGMTSASWALSVEEKFVMALQEQGFTIVEQGHTLFGRFRIVAENQLMRREIVVNRNTGEILRDYSVLLADLPGGDSGPAVAQDTQSAKSGQKAAVKSAENGAQKSTRNGGTKSNGQTSLSTSVATATAAPSSGVNGSAMVVVGDTYGDDRTDDEPVILPAPIDISPDDPDSVNSND